jgi:mono/diheme cytochrome c family protein
MRRLDHRLVVPLLGLAIVVSLAAVLTMQVTWRPWSEPDNHWRTALTLLDEVPEGYTRTLVAGTDGAGPIDAWALKPDVVIPPEEMGRALYVASGCASCHGIDARGGLVGPDITGLEPDLVIREVRAPSGRMPAYKEVDLSDEELAEIADYLRSLEPEAISDD